MNCSQSFTLLSNERHPEFAADLSLQADPVHIPLTSGGRTDANQSKLGSGGRDLCVPDQTPSYNPECKSYSFASLDLSDTYSEQVFVIQQ